MTPKDKAEELISDYIQIQVGCTSLSNQYESVKIQAQYACHVAKFSHKLGSKKFKYWNQVKQEIEKL